MSIKKTIIVTVAIAASVAMVAPMLAGATTVSDLMVQIASLQAQLSSLSGTTTTTTGSVPAACTGVTFTRNLVVGSTGSDVKCLQALLSVTPQSGYFGPLTLAAVRAYQTEQGWTPANQVGPMTRAALNARLVGTSTVTTTTTTTNFPAGCTSTAGFSATTGVSCATSVTNLPAGCLSTAGFSPVTGASCTVGVSLPYGCTSTSGYSQTTGVSCATGVASPVLGTTGFLSLDSIAASPASNANVTTTSNIPVFGVNLKAIGSNMTVGSVKLQLTDIKARGTAAAVTEHPASLVTNLYVYDGGTLLGTYPVNVNTVVKNGADYYVILSGFNFMIPGNTIKTLTINADFAPSLETSRQLTVDLYGTDAIRGTDTSGAYTSVGETSLTLTGSTTTLSAGTTTYARQYTVTYSTVGTSTLATTIDPNTPISTDIAVSDVNGTTNVPMSVLDFKSTTGPSTITSITLTATGNTGNAASAIGHINALKLYDGSTLIGSQTPSAVSTTRTATFSNLSIPVAQDATKVLTVMADMAAGSDLTNGTYFGVNIATASDVAYQTPAMSSASATGTTTGGNDMYFYDGGATAISLVSTTASYTPIGTTASNGIASGIITFNFKPTGGTLTKPISTDFTVLACTSAGSCAISPSVALKVTPNTATIGNGNIATVEVDASFVNSSTYASGYYYFEVTSAVWHMTGVTGTMSASPSGTDNSSSEILNWKTSNIYVY